MKRYIAAMAVMAVLLASLIVCPVMAEETEDPINIVIRTNMEKAYYGDTIHVSWTVENAVKPYEEFYACWDVFTGFGEEDIETEWEGLEEVYEMSFPVEYGIAGSIYVDVIDANGNYAYEQKIIDFIDPKAVLVEEISFEMNEIVIEEGQSAKPPKTTILPSNATDKSIRWSSGDMGVAYVFEDDGLILGVHEGTTYLRAEAADRGGAVGITAIRVVPKGQAVKKIALNHKKASLQAGKKLKLKAELTPRNVYDDSILWKSSNTAVVTVDSKGRIKAVSPGKATITAVSSSGKKAKCKVTVTPAMVRKITIDGIKVMKKGETQTLEVSVRPVNAADARIKWKTSDKRIATVDKNGVVTALKKGTVVITAHAKDGSGVKAAFRIKVKKK